MRVAWCLLLVVCGPLSAAGIPRLEVDAPPRWAAEAAGLEERVASRLQAAADLIGTTDPGLPVRVVLLPESSPAARQVPRNISGFARHDLDLAVLLPERVPRYPDGDLEILLVHEVSHLMLARASGGAAVPRWYSEGVALLASRGWSFSDRSRVLLGGLRGAPASTGELEAMFTGTPANMSAAYALAGALVNDLTRRHGFAAVGGTLKELSHGAAFEEAFARATTEPLEAAVTSFWRRIAIWYRWVPFLTSGTTLWMAITALVLLAFARRRQRDAAIRQRWDEEERASSWQEAEDAGDEGSVN